MVKKSIINIIKAYITKLQKNGIIVDSAYLYGSYAHDAFTIESDIDILIITDSKEDSDIVSGKAWNLTRDINPKIEPYIVAKDRFYQYKNNPLFDIIKQEGILIQ